MIMMSCGPIEKSYWALRAKWQTNRQWHVFPHQSRIANCNTRKNSRGRITRPCHMPPMIFNARAIGSTNFMMVPGTYRIVRPHFHWESKLNLIARAKAWACYESRPLGSTLRIFNRILLCIKRFVLFLCSMHTEYIHLAPAP